MGGQIPMDLGGLRSISCSLTSSLTHPPWFRPLFAQQGANLLFLRYAAWRFAARNRWAESSCLELYGLNASTSAIRNLRSVWGPTTAGLLGFDLRHLSSLALGRVGVAMTYGIIGSGQVSVRLSVLSRLHPTSICITLASSVQAPSGRG